MSSRKSIIPLFLILLIFYTTNSESIAQENNDVRQIIENAGCGEKFNNAASVIIFDSTIVDVQESGLSYVHNHRLVKILNTKGAVANNLLIFGYEPLSADISIKLAKIYRADGTEDVVPAEKVYDYPAPARMIYWGARSKAVEIGRLEPGDAVEIITFRKGFTYALLMDNEEDKFIPPMKGHFYDIVNFWTGTPILSKVYKIYVPENKPLQYEIYNGEVSSYIHFNAVNDKDITVRINPHKIEKEPAKIAGREDEINRSGKTEYCWYKNDIMPFRGEPNMLAASDVATKLLVSTSRDWYQKAVWFHGVNEDYGSFEVTPEVQAKTDELLSGVSDEMEKIQILTHWCADEIRYSGISMGEGEGYTLHKGEMTFADRCGVCKDKAGMLITMLRAAGFESYAAMTMAGSRIDKIPADQFNHSVTVAKLKNGDWILLDPTWVPGVRELWSSAEQQQQFLMGIPGGADIMTTPVSPAENHYLKINAETELLKNGTLKGKLIFTAEGQTDSRVRRAFSRSWKSNWNEGAARIMKSVSPVATVDDFEFGDPSDYSDPVKIEISFTIPDYSKNFAGEERFIPITALDPLKESINTEFLMDTSLTERKYGFRIGCSKLVEIDENIKIADGKVEFIPDFTDIETKPASFKAKYTVKGKKINLKSTLRFEKRLYESADWPGFRSVIAERQKLSDTPIIIKK